SELETSELEMSEPRSSILESHLPVLETQVAPTAHPWSSWGDLGIAVRRIVSAAADRVGTAAPKVRRWATVDLRTWGKRVSSPLGALIIIALVLAGLVSFALFAPSGETPATTGSMPDIGSTSTQPNVPAATQSFGNQIAQFVWDKDGAKHFTFTAKQVMWEPVK